MGETSGTNRTFVYTNRNPERNYSLIQQQTIYKLLTGNDGVGKESTPRSSSTQDLVRQGNNKTR